MDQKELEEAFVAEVTSMLAKACEILNAMQDQKGHPKTDIFELMRFFHTVKSSAAVMGLPHLSERCRDMEQRWKTCVDAGVAASADLLFETKNALDSVKEEMRKLRAHE